MGKTATYGVNLCYGAAASVLEFDGRLTVFFHECVPFFSYFCSLASVFLCIFLFCFLRFCVLALFLHLRLFCLFHNSNNKFRRRTKRDRCKQANLEHLRDNHRKALKLLASCHGFQGAEEYSGPGEAVGPPYFNNMVRSMISSTHRYVPPKRFCCCRLINPMVG